LETELLISPAYAQTAGAAANAFSIESMALPAVLVVVFYFLLLRPQQKRAKEQKAMIDAIKSGDEVITAGGVLGKVTKVSDHYITLEVAQAGNAPVELMVQKSALQTVLPKGTLKSI
jgi:preprotein translocase subunit YajC